MSALITFGFFSCTSKTVKIEEKSLVKRYYLDKDTTKGVLSLDFDIEIPTAYADTNVLKAIHDTVIINIFGRKYLLMKTGQNNIQTLEHALRAVDLAKDVLNIGLDTAQYADAIDDPRQHPQVDEVPEMRRIGHLGTMIRGGKQPDPLAPGFGHIIMDGAIGMGTGYGVAMNINWIVHDVSNSHSL